MCKIKISRLSRDMRSHVFSVESFRSLLELDGEADVVVDKASCVVVTLDRNRFQQNIEKKLNKT